MMSLIINGVDYADNITNYELVKDFYNIPCEATIFLVLNGKNIKINSSFEFKINNILVLKGKLSFIKLTRTSQIYDSVIICNDSSIDYIFQTAGKLNYKEEVNISSILDELGLEYLIEEDFTLTNISKITDNAKKYIDRICKQYGYIFYSDGEKAIIGRSSVTNKSPDLIRNSNTKIYEQIELTLDYRKTHTNIHFFSDSFIVSYLPIQQIEDRVDNSILTNERVVVLPENSKSDVFPKSSIMYISKERVTERDIRIVIPNIDENYKINTVCYVEDSQLDIKGTFFIYKIHFVYKDINGKSWSYINLTNYDSLTTNGISSQENKNIFGNKYIK